MGRIYIYLTDVTILLVATSSFVVGWNDGNSNSNSNNSNNSSCKKISEIICTTSSLSKFCTAMKDTGLDEILRNTDPLTVFVPNNYAFNMLPNYANDAIMNINVLKDVVKYHVSNTDELFFSYNNDINCQDKLKMLNGGFTTTKCMNGNYFQVGVGNTDDYDYLPEVIDKDNKACNGVIHIIDQVMLPVAGPKTDDFHNDDHWDSNDYCTWKVDSKCYMDGHPYCCNKNNNLKCDLNKAPECDYKYHDDDDKWDGHVGDYCTVSPNYECYKKGWPRCCDKSNNLDCNFNKKPMCDYEYHDDTFMKYDDDYCEDDQYYRYEGYDSKGCKWIYNTDMCNVKDKDGYHIGKEHCPKSCDRCEKYDDDKHYDNDWVGGHFCTWGPDYECFDGGWPRCCSSKNHFECSNKQPECEKYDNDWVGGHFCTWGPDYDCFDGGWPRCCSSNNHVNCSNKQPECEKYDYCEDDQYYRYEGYGSKGCNWIYNNDMCNDKDKEGYTIGKAHCPQSCDYCNSHNDDGIECTTIYDPVVCTATANSYDYNEFSNLCKALAAGFKESNCSKK